MMLSFVCYLDGIKHSGSIVRAAHPFPSLILVMNINRNLETAANGTDTSRIQKFQKLLNLRNANHSTENSRNSGSKVEWKENIPEHWKMLFHSLLEVAENSNQTFWLNGNRA